MTRTKSILIILLSLMTSNLVTAQQIRKFESSLGRKRTKAVNEIILDFEKYLDSNFTGNTIEAKYDRYLESISKGSTSRKWEIDSQKMDKYKELELFNEYINVYPDSVWYDGEFVNWNYQGEIIESIIPINRVCPDTIISNVKKELQTILLVKGRFFAALETIIEENPLIDGLLDFELATSNKTRKHPYEIQQYAGELKKAKLDYTDYFVKRIIVIGTYEFE